MVISEGLLGKTYWAGVKEKQDQYAVPGKSVSVCSDVPTYGWNESMQSKSPSGSLRSTSWLDGLRGFAALLVRVPD